ncbi:choice-of-anchor J domain-containing protein [Peribacillus sp. SCS-37]|uniref:choice-of-anchor J domain-containing protein n=1 Tax=Paraperibacillus esterisolvens TaxID=3115296 RepID=UPI0039063117
MKKQMFSVLAAGALILSLFSPDAISAKAAGNQAPAAEKWDVERYGDRMDVDGYLNQLSKDVDFNKKALDRIKEQAKNINFNETSSTESKTSGSSFTYDGGTKQFLNRNLKFKPFTLRSVGKNVEIWVANDLSFPAGDSRPAHVVTQEQVDKLKNEFDSNIYPKATEFFGTPDKHDGSQSPLAGKNVPAGYYEGSDKVIMLVDNIQDENYTNPAYPFFVAGFYWQTLENYIDRNIITIDTNSWETRLESTFFGTTIHELQHLIHADNDAAEETWINEGMSTFSEYLGGYGHDASSINFYLDHPENSLVNWDEHQGAPTGPETIADYGQVYLFTLYMYDKFGREFIRDLALSKEQGIKSINATFKEYGIKKMDFTKLYQDFITALAIDSGKKNDPYNFESIDLRDLPVDNKGTKRGMTVNYEKAVQYEKEGVPAWGGDFKKLDFEEKVRSVKFNGIEFLPTPWKQTADPKNPNNQVLWGNTGDESDNAIVLEADLTNARGSALTFDTFYQIEEQWDFGVVQVSEDGGKTWKSLSNEHTRTDVVDEGYPKIKENVPGFTGTNGGWTNEKFSLAAYDGKNILISFRYLTDWGTNENGWYIDNIKIPQINFTSDGSLTPVFKSMNEINKQYVEYTITFINEKVKGNKTDYKVVTLDPFNINKEKFNEIYRLFQDGKNSMITTYAAPPGDRNPVEFTYEFEFKKKKNKNKK